MVFTCAFLEKAELFFALQSSVSRICDRKPPDAGGQVVFSPHNFTYNQASPLFPNSIVRELSVTIVIDLALFGVGKF